MIIGMFPLRLIFCIILLCHYCICIRLGFFNLPIRIKSSNNTKKVLTTTEKTFTLSGSDNVNLEKEIQKITETEINKNHDAEEEITMTTQLEDTLEECDKENSTNTEGQEIDETRTSNSACKYDNNKIKNETENFEIDYLNMEKNESKFFEKPLLKKKKIIKIPTTVIKVVTKYETVHPSCLKLSNIKSVCDGRLSTSYPVIYDDSRPNKFTESDSVDNISDDLVMAERSEKINIQPTASVAINPTSIVESQFNEKEEFVKSSEGIDENQEIYDESMINGMSTPALGDRNIDNVEESELSDYKKLSFKPNIKFVTKYLFSTTTKTIMDMATKATVVAKNCIPSDIRIPLCNYESILHELVNNLHLYPNPNLPNTDKLSNEISVNKNDDIIERLNNYLITNKDRILESTGFETIDLNADAAIVESADKITSITDESCAENKG